MNLLLVPSNSSAGWVLGCGTGTVLLVPSSPKSSPLRLSRAVELVVFAAAGLLVPDGSDAFNLAMASVSGDEVAALLMGCRPAFCRHQSRSTVNSTHLKRPAARQLGDSAHQKFALFRHLAHIKQNPGIGEIQTVFWHGASCVAFKKLTVFIPALGFHRNQSK